MTISFIKSFLKEFSARNKNGRVLTKEINNCSFVKKKKSHFCLKTFFFKTHFLFENFILEISVNIFDGTENCCQQLAVLLPTI